MAHARKRFALLTGAVLTALLAAAWLEPTRILRGLATGESFFEARPASWWAKRITSDDPADQSEFPQRLRLGAADAVPVLIELLRFSNPHVRLRAAELLSQMNATAWPASAQLTIALKDSDPLVRKVAAQALGEIGPKGLHSSAVPGLTEMLATSDRYEALRALAKLHSHEPVPEIIRLLADRDATIRWNAARTLGKLRAKQAIPVLVKALKDDDGQVREHAAEALGDIGPDAAEAVEPLIGVLSDPEPKVRRDAVRALGQFGPAARSALPQVEKLLKDPEAIVREAATTAKRKMETVKP